MTVAVPVGSNNGSRTGLSAASSFVDDVMLATINFAGGVSGTVGGAVAYNAAGGSFRDVVSARVLSGFANVNAEYGDLDTGSDGNPNPFVSAGVIAEGSALPDATRETTVAAIQNAAIRASFNSLSLVQGIDGEGPPFSLDIIFRNGIRDNNTLFDTAPELLFFERGVNSNFRIQAIIGGTELAPVLGGSVVTVTSGQMWASPYFIDTIEIASGQRLGVAAIDLTELALPTGAILYGLRVTGYDSSGPDLYGQYIAAADPSQFAPGMLDVPEPGTLAFLLGLPAAVLALRRRR